MRLCKDCIHYEDGKAGGCNVHRTDPVKGESITYMACGAAREHECYCGKDAKDFRRNEDVAKCPFCGHELCILQSECVWTVRCNHCTMVKSGYTYLTKQAAIEAAKKRA